MRPGAAPRGYPQPVTVTVLREELRADVEAHLERPARPIEVVASVLVVRSVQAALLYRLSRLAYLHGLRPVAFVLCRVSQLLFQVDIDPYSMM